MTSWTSTRRRHTRSPSRLPSRGDRRFGKTSTAGRCARAERATTLMTTHNSPRGGGCFVWPPARSHSRARGYDRRVADFPPVWDRVQLDAVAPDHTGRWLTARSAQGNGRPHGRGAHCRERMRRSHSPALAGVCDVPAQRLRSGRRALRGRADRSGWRDTRRNLSSRLSGPARISPPGLRGRNGRLHANRIIDKDLPELGHQPPATRSTAGGARLAAATATSARWGEGRDSGERLANRRARADHRSCRYRDVLETLYVVDPGRVGSRAQQTSSHRAPESTILPPALETRPAARVDSGTGADSGRERASHLPVTEPSGRAV